jgi:hypothetical protein
MKDSRGRGVCEGWGSRVRLVIGLRKRIAQRGGGGDMRILPEDVRKMTNDGGSLKKDRKNRVMVIAN